MIKMSKINESLTAIILYLLISYILGLPNMEYGILIAVLGSQINIILPKNYKHTLILYIPMSILTITYPAVMVPTMIGYASSIFISLLSKNGCKLLYPIRETAFTGPKNYLENDSRGDYAATTFLVTLTVITLLLSFNGTQIIDELSQTNDISTYFDNHQTGYNNSPEAVQYININPAYSVNKNITTIQTENTTTTLITEYTKK